MIYVQASSVSSSTQTLSPPPVLELGSDQGRWRFVEKMGEGPIGEVFRVDPLQSELTSRGSFSYKRILPPMSRDASFARAFLQATSRVSRLDHTSLPRVYEHGEAGGCLYVVTSFHDGFSLARILRFLRSSGDHLDAAMVARLFAQLASALGAAHLARGGDRSAPWPLVHGNLKPSNILLQASGVPMLLDLGSGAAGLLDPEGALLWLSRESLRYCAPEVVRGTEPDPRSDVWSLGALLFELLTLEPLIEAAPPLTLLRTLPDFDPTERLRLLEARKLPSGLVRLVQGALQRRQKLRIQDAAAFSDALLDAALPLPWTPEEYWGELLSTLRSDEAAQRPETSRIYLVPGEDEDSTIPWDLCWMDDVTATEHAWRLGTAPTLLSEGRPAGAVSRASQLHPSLGIVLIEDEDTFDESSEVTLSWTDDALDPSDGARHRAFSGDNPIMAEDLATEVPEAHEFPAGPLVLHAEDLEATDPGGDEEEEDPDITVERPIPSFLEQVLPEQARSELGQALSERAASAPPSGEEDEDESQAAVVDFEALESIRSGSDAFQPENEGVSDESFKTVHIPVALTSFTPVEAVEDETGPVAADEDEEDVADEIPTQGSARLTVAELAEAAAPAVEPGVTAADDESPPNPLEAADTEEPGASPASALEQAEPEVQAAQSALNPPTPSEQAEDVEVGIQAVYEQSLPATPAEAQTADPSVLEPQAPETAEQGRRGGRKKGASDVRKTGKRRSSGHPEGGSEASAQTGGSGEERDATADAGLDALSLAEAKTARGPKTGSLPRRSTEGQTSSTPAEPPTSHLRSAPHATGSLALTLPAARAESTVALTLPPPVPAEQALEFVETEAESAFFGVAVPAGVASASSTLTPPTINLPRPTPAGPEPQLAPRRRAGQTTDELWRAPREDSVQSDRAQSDRVQADGVQTRSAGFLTEDAGLDLGDTPVSQEYRGPAFALTSEPASFTSSPGLILPPSPSPLPSIEEDDTAKFELAVLLDRLAQQKQLEHKALSQLEDSARSYPEAHKSEEKVWLSEQIPDRAVAFAASTIAHDEPLGAAPYPTSPFGESTVEISIQDEGLTELETEVEALSESDMPIPMLPSTGPVDLVRVQKLADGRLEEMPANLSALRATPELPPLVLEMGADELSSDPYAEEDGPGMALESEMAEHPDASRGADTRREDEARWGSELTSTPTEMSSVSETSAFELPESPYLPVEALASEDFSTMVGFGASDLEAGLTSGPVSASLLHAPEQEPLPDPMAGRLTPSTPELPPDQPAGWEMTSAVGTEEPGESSAPSTVLAAELALPDGDEEDAEDLPLASIPLPTSNPMSAAFADTDVDEVFDESSTPLASSGPQELRKGLDRLEVGLEPSSEPSRSGSDLGIRFLSSLEEGADPLSDSNLMIPIELDLLPAAALAATFEGEELEAPDPSDAEPGEGAELAPAPPAGPDDAMEALALEEAEEALVLDDPVVETVPLPLAHNLTAGGRQPGQKLAPLLTNFTGSVGEGTGPDKPAMTRPGAEKTGADRLSLEKGPITRSARRTQPDLPTEGSPASARGSSTPFPPPFVEGPGSILKSPGQSVQNREGAGGPLPSLPERLGGGNAAFAPSSTPQSTVVTTQPVVATRTPPPPPGRQVGGRSSGRATTASPWDGPSREEAPGGRAGRAGLPSPSDIRSTTPRTPSWLRPVSRRPVLLEGQQVAGRYQVEHLLLEFPERSVYSALEVIGDHHRLCYVCGDAQNLPTALHCQTCGSDLGSRRMTLSMRWDRRRVERNLLLAERTLDHPGLARVYHQFTSEGRLYRVLDLITEDPATGVLLMQLAGPLDELMLAEIGVQVAISLHYLHQNGINCPFLSEDNIFLLHDRVQLYDLDVDEVVSPGLLPASMRIKDVMVLARVLLPYLPRDGGGLVNVLQDATEGRIGSAEDFAYAMQEAAGILPGGAE